MIPRPFPGVRTVAATAAAVLALAAVAAVAQEIDDARKYETCMNQVRQDPDKAFDTALAWRDLGGGDAARHCLAAALMGLKHYAEAAQRFERLAQEIKAEPAFKAKLLGQGAQAWLLDGKPGRAEAVLTAALKLAPDTPALLVDRAEARAALSAYWEAVDDLNRAVELDPRRPDAYVFRAAAYRMLDSLDLAEDDLAQALALNPLHPEALLERGIVRRLKGDDNGARRDWLKVLTVAPGTPTAEAAQRNIEKMDVKVR